MMAREATERVLDLHVPVEQRTRKKRRAVERGR
jgi:hypothetical protein